MPNAPLRWWRRRSRRQRVWLSIAAVVFLFGLPGTFTNACTTETVPAANPAPTTARSPPTTAAATTTTLSAQRQAAIEGLLAAPTPTTLPEATPECQTYALMTTAAMQNAGELTTDLGDALLDYDIDLAQDLYGQVKWYMDDYGNVAAAMLSACAPRMTGTERAVIETEVATTLTGWAELQAVCRADLAPLGFDC